MFNALYQILLQHTKTAILVACGVFDIACTARWLRKLNPSTCRPTVMQFLDENDATSFWCHERESVGSDLHEFPDQLSYPSSGMPNRLCRPHKYTDNPLDQQGDQLYNRAARNASITESHRRPITNHRPPCPPVKPVPYGIVPKRVAPSTACTCFDAPMALLYSECSVITLSIEPAPNHSSVSRFIALQDPETSSAPENGLSASPLVKTANVLISPVEPSPGPEKSDAVPLPVRAMTTPDVDSTCARNSPRPAVSPRSTSTKIRLWTQAFIDKAGFRPYVARHDTLLRLLDNKPHETGREYRKSWDFSLTLPTSKLSNDRQSLRVSLECREESTIFRDLSRCKLLIRLFRGHCTRNSYSVACLRSTDGSFITYPVNIADHLNAYSASCYLHFPLKKHSVVRPHTKSGLKQTTFNYREIHHKPLLVRTLERLARGPLTSVLLATNAIDYRQYELLSQRAVNDCQLYFLRRSQQPMMPHALVITSGGVQGSVPGPIFFLLYMNDVIDDVSRGKLCLFAENKNRPHSSPSAKTFTFNQIQQASDSLTRCGCLHLLFLNERTVLLAWLSPDRIKYLVFMVLYYCTSRNYNSLFACHLADLVACTRDGNLVWWWPNSRKYEQALRLARAASRTRSFKSAELYVRI
ncbi:hypothetical protein CLF_108812 [Clonorchis sinensis]|uniref:Uncharacterized protein n=1 Tax=Clonorchis sinensis TaxID=79923 RepID=G7YIK4_CLOSI|nr:hypothetical protein CLF_108812 [Clonorchis sinensis]